MVLDREADGADLPILDNIQFDHVIIIHGICMFLAWGVFPIVG